MKRKPGQLVEVRIRGKSPANNSWHVRVIESVGDNGQIVVKESYPGDLVAREYYGHNLYRCRFYSKSDVRKPRKRVTTGKVRGRGGKGGWVMP